MATQTYTNGVTLTDATEFNNFDSVAYSVLSGVAGTNTITATGPANYTLSATRPPVWFVPAVTNTGATTIAITPSGGAALTAKNIFAQGVACIGGELVAGVPVGIVYDGTQFNITAGGRLPQIVDKNGNEIVKLSATASAVNEITVSNGATGGNPSLTATGGDTNVGLSVIPKGTGKVQIHDGTDASKSAAWDVSAVTTATARTVTMPDANVDLQYARAASDTIAGGIEIATQAEMETGSSTTLAVTPGRLVFHPGVPKAWGHVDSNGNVAASFGLSGATDGGTGVMTFNLSTNMSSTAYPTFGCAEATVGTAVVALVDGKAVGSFTVKTIASTTGAATDPSYFEGLAMGDR